MLHGVSSMQKIIKNSISCMLRLDEHDKVETN